MPKPPGVMIASAWFVFCGILMGFVAMLVLIGSVVKVQNSKGMTGIFPNSVVGGMGIFVATLILLLAIAIVGLGVGLWRMR